MFIWDYMNGYIQLKSPKTQYHHQHLIYETIVHEFSHETKMNKWVLTELSYRGKIGSMQISKPIES